MSKLTPEQEYIKLYQRMAKETLQASTVGATSVTHMPEVKRFMPPMFLVILWHQLSPEQMLLDPNGEEIEYKSTTTAKVKGSYTGISVQDTWKSQVKYLREDKILKYPLHFFNRFEGGKLVESWCLTGQQVYQILLPKLEKKYPTVLSKKDPRLSANVTNTEIKKYGKRII